MFGFSFFLLLLLLFYTVSGWDLVPSKKLDWVFTCSPFYLLRKHHPIDHFLCQSHFKNKTQIHVTVLLQFCHILPYPRKRRRKVLPLDCPNVISAHSSVPASGQADRKDAAEEGCDEGALIDKLNYQQSQNPSAFFYLAWREIFSAIIPAVMKFLLEM